MKRDKTQLYSKMTKNRVSSLNKKSRDLTPDLQIRNNINFISSENNLLSVSNNQSLSFFRPEQKRIKNRIMSSYSPKERTSKNSINPIILSIIKGRSISKRIINNYRKNISSLKKNYGFTSSRSKNKRKQKKQIPFHKKKLQQLSVNTFQSNETINSNNTIANTNSNNLFVHSSKLSEKEIKSLMMINNMITNLLSTTSNKALIFSELDNIYKNAFASMNVNYNEYAKGNNTSDNIIHSNSTNNNTTDDSNNNIFNKLDAINTKCEIIQEENNKLKKLIPKSSETFEDVKESIKNFKAEINKIKKNSTIPTTKKISKPLQAVDNKTVSNKNKYPIKNISLNLQLVQKVKDIKNICSDSQRNSKNKENDTIIETQIKNEEMNDINLENIANNKVHDFNDEFLENYEDFSPSWRREVDKMNQRKKDYQMM